MGPRMAITFQFMFRIYFLKAGVFWGSLGAHPRGPVGKIIDLPLLQAVNYASTFFWNDPKKD